jgi:hypothetical protein
MARNRLATATSLARRALPAERYHQLRRGYRAASLTNLNDELMLSHGAHPAPLAEAFKLAATIPGYFTYDDAVALPMTTQWRSRHCSPRRVLSACAAISSR